MPEDVIKSLSSKLIAWLLGLIGSIVVFATVLIFNFYLEWNADEAAEDAIKEQEKSLMFDSPGQKEEIKDHTYEAVPALEQRLKLERDNDFQKQVLEQLKQMQKIDTLNADQVFQIKEELKELKKKQVKYFLIGWVGEIDGKVAYGNVTLKAEIFYNLQTVKKQIQEINGAKGVAVLGHSTMTRAEYEILTLDYDTIYNSVNEIRA